MTIHAQKTLLIDVNNDLQFLNFCCFHFYRKKEKKIWMIRRKNVVACKKSRQRNTRFMPKKATNRRQQWLAIFSALKRFSFFVSLIFSKAVKTSRYFVECRNIKKLPSIFKLLFFYWKGDALIWREKTVYVSKRQAKHINLEWYKWVKKKFEGELIITVVSSMKYLIIICQNLMGSVNLM